MIGKFLRSLYVGRITEYLSSGNAIMTVTLLEYNLVTYAYCVKTTGIHLTTNPCSDPYYEANAEYCDRNLIKQRKKESEAK